MVSYNGSHISSKPQIYTKTTLKDHNPRKALERPVINYWGGVDLNMFYWIESLALSFCSGSKHLVPIMVS